MIKDYHKGGRIKLLKQRLGKEEKEKWIQTDSRIHLCYNRTTLIFCWSLIWENKNILAI